MATEIRSNSIRIGRAIEIGRELGKFDRDFPGLHRLSREAWRRQCGELAGVASLAELVTLRDKIEAKAPALWSEIWTTAEKWRRGRQDRPAPFNFANPHRFVAAYAEMLAFKLSDQQASGVAAYVASEGWSDADFGRLGGFDELPALIEPRERELGELDRELAATVRLADLAWDGSQPLLRHAGFAVPVGLGTVDRIASAFAEASRYQVERQPVAA